MSKIRSDLELRAAIEQLEEKRRVEEMELREQLRITYESIKPINLIRSTYQEIVESQDLKDSLINTSVGLTARYLSKTLFEGVSHSPLRKLMGTVLLFGVTNAVRNNPEAVRSLGNNVFKLIRGITNRQQVAINNQSS